MGFRTTIQNLVESAFVTLGDITETITYNSVSVGNYDTYSGQNTDVSTEYSLKGVVKFLGEQVGGNATDIAFTGDIAFMFASKDLAITPTTRDTITRGSEVYSINSIKSDPVVATYTLNLVKLG